MGGDYAPQAVVSGAVLAAGLIAPQSKIVLFGDRPSIEELLAKENFRADAFDIVHTTQVIEMGDNPALTFRQKPDSSIAVGFRHLTEGRIDGFASAGSTGAMMVGCMYTVKQIEGIIRPAISSVIPTIDGGSVMLLDVGLNVDCKPEVLYQYAVIGNLYAQGVLGKKEPRIALLNIGEEKEKGKAALSCVIDFAKGKNMMVTAEGVETQAHVDFLKKAGVNNLQGYLISKPLDPKACMVFLEKYQHVDILEVIKKARTHKAI